MMRILVMVFVLGLIIKEGVFLLRRKAIRYQDLWINNKGLMFVYVLSLGALLIVGALFKLQVSYLSILAMSSILVFYHIVRQLKYFHIEFDRVTQFILVMSHLSHQFKTHQKIEHALAEVFEVCNDNTKEKLEEVEHHLEKLGYQEAFGMYHQHYLLKTLVTTMAHAQEQGDDNIFHALNLIEQDIDELNNHVFIYIQKMMQLRNKILMLCIFGLGVSYVSQNMLNMVVDLSALGLYQDMVFLFILCNMLLLGFSFNILTLPLLMKEELLV